MARQNVYHSMYVCILCLCMYRACVVSVDWLVECFKQSHTVSEQPYICQTVDQCSTNATTASTAVTSAAVPVGAPGAVRASRAVGASGAIGGAAPGASVGAVGAVLVDDGEMNDLLSPYICMSICLCIELVWRVWTGWWNASNNHALYIRLRVM